MVLLVSTVAWAGDPSTAPSLGAASPRTGLLRVVLGLAGAFLMAVLATHPLVRRLERRLGLTVILSSGLPFLALGVVFRLPVVGILTNEVVSDLRPLLEFGVGWLGFVVGLQFDVRELDLLPDRTSSVVVAESTIPFVVVAVIASLLLLGLEPTQQIWEVHSPREFFTTLGQLSLRDALALGACAAPAAPVAAVAIARESGGRAAWLVQRITSMNDVAGVFVMALICAFYRPADDFAAWRLPHVAWLFVILGLGGLFGILTYLLVRGAQTVAQEVAMLLGAIAISAGMSGYLGISPLVTCAIAGALLTNLPYKGMVRLRKTMLDMERPLYLIFLLVAGALWDPTAWQGWLIVPFFVLARVSGKVLGAHLGKRLGPEGLPDAGTLGLALAPQSPISIATCVAYITLYNPSSRAGVLSWLMTACVGGAVLTEIVVQVVVRIRGGLNIEEMRGIPSILPPAMIEAVPSDDGGGAAQDPSTPRDS
jgi:Kef-type K+ transport system membrane component KefB